VSFLKSLLKANKEIYTLLIDNNSNTLFKYKTPKNQTGAGGDRSLVIDLKAEEIFVKYLSKFGQIHSEESGIIGDGKNTIIIDPIDGSSNISSGFPYFGSSVTLKVNGKAKISVIVNFANGDYFVKTPKKCYESNFNITKKIPIKINKTSQVGIVEKGYIDSKITKKIKKLGLKFRVAGATALSLAYAHRVNFVIFIGKPRVYDIIGGLHLCQDLNCYVSNEIIIVSKDEKTFKKLKKSLV
jgi:myo-inositol-1(or 4)-monophosphatase